MSNTAALGVLVRKFPLHEAVKWQKYLAKQDRSIQAKPFPAFMKWVEKAGALWQILTASGTGARGRGSSQVHHSVYGDYADNSKQGRPCFKSREVGHWERNCPQG